VSRVVLAASGFVPVSLIAASTFGVVGLRPLAIGILLPAAVAVAVVMARRPEARGLVVKSLLAACLATGLYDLWRFSFLWVGLMHKDPIPHIGVALGLHPAWVFGYLWRYAGNGGGLAIAFFALGFRGVRNGILFGLFVCGGLFATLIVSPHAQEVLFPLNATTIVMGTVGHMIYGAVLGAISTRTSVWTNNAPAFDGGAE
jgi:hypothetical protein